MRDDAGDADADADANDTAAADRKSAAREETGVPVGAQASTFGKNKHAEAITASARKRIRCIILCCGRCSSS